MTTDAEKEAVKDLEKLLASLQKLQGELGDLAKVVPLDPFSEIGKLKDKDLDKSSPLIGHLLAVKINTGGEIRTTLVTPYGLNKDTGMTEFLWEVGPSRFGVEFVDTDDVRPGRAKVLHDYGPPPNNDSDNYNWDEIDAHLEGLQDGTSDNDKL